jgi:hypothetical protein
MFRSMNIQSLSIFRHRKDLRCEFQTLCWFQNLEKSLNWKGSLARGPWWPMATCPGQRARHATIAQSPPATSRTTLPTGRHGHARRPLPSDSSVRPSSRPSLLLLSPPHHLTAAPSPSLCHHCSPVHRVPLPGAVCRASLMPSCATSSSSKLGLNREPPGRRLAWSHRPPLTLSTAVSEGLTVAWHLRPSSDPADTPAGSVWATRSSSTTPSPPATYGPRSRRWFPSACTLRHEEPRLGEPFSSPTPQIGLPSPLRALVLRPDAPRQLPLPEWVAIATPAPWGQLPCFGYGLPAHGGSGPTRMG